MSWTRAILLEDAHPSFVGKPPGYCGFHHPAVVDRTADVEGERLPLYRMSDDRHPWPARADVVRLLDGFTCAAVDGGGGLDHLATPTGRLAVVSPRAVAIAAGFALAAGRITPERESALLKAVREAA